MLGLIASCWGFALVVARAHEPVPDARARFSSLTSNTEATVMNVALLARRRFGRVRLLIVVPASCRRDHLSRLALAALARTSSTT